MDHIDLDLLGRQLLQRLGQCLLRALDIGLEDQRQGLDFALRHLLEHVLELGRLLLGQLDVPELALAEQRDLARLALVGEDDRLLAGGRHVGQAEDLDRDRRTSFIDRFTVLVEHRPHPAVGAADQQHVALSQRARLNQQGGHRATALVEARLDDQTLGRCIHRCRQLQHLGLQQQPFEQIVDALAGLR